MSTLPPDASIEDVEEEIIFYQTLLETLDPEADDFDSRQQEYEQVLRALEARLPSPSSNSEQRPETPDDRTETTDSTLVTPSALFSAGMPSRERGQRSSGPAQLDGAASPTPTRPSGHKRPLSSVEDEHSNKARRQSGMEDIAETPRASTNLPPAQSSTLGSKLGSNHILLQRIKEREQQWKNNQERERGDESYARSFLEADSAAGPSTSRSIGTPSGNGSQNASYQATLNQQGRFDRPARHTPLSHELPWYTPSLASAKREPPATDLYLPSMDPSMHEPTLARVKSESNGIPSSALKGESALRGKNVKSLPDGISWDFAPRELDYARRENSDSSLEEITPEQFRFLSDQAPATSSRSLENPHKSSAVTLATGRGNLDPWAGAADGSSSSNYWGIGPAFTSGISNALSNGASSVNKMWNGIQSAIDLTSGNAYAPFDAFMPRSHNFDGYQPATGSVYQMEDESRYNLDDDLRERGLEHMLNDPTQTREELEQLLNNIRPDEDIPPEMRIGTPAALQVPLMEHQKLGLTWLKKQEESSNKGAILADDMGLGKTIQALALMVSRPSDNAAVKTNLVVAPVALLRQWQSEIETKIKRNHSLHVCIYHGAKKGKHSYTSLCGHDVVLTTYGTLAAEFKRKQEHDLRLANNPGARARPNENFVFFGERRRWYRVILDEAQCIKNKSTRSSHAAAHLNAVHRLCMTGTPMMNNVGELYSLIRFLRIGPYNILENFNREFSRPLSRTNVAEKARGMRALQALLKAILLRRTKKAEIDGKPILANLPERHVEQVHAVFDDEQAAVYKAVEEQLQIQVNKYLSSGSIGRNYSYILVRLLRLRQAACHPHLMKDFAEDASGIIPAEDMEAWARKLSEGTVKMIKEANGAFECPVCYDAITNPTIFFPCGHDMCSECFARMTDPAQALAQGEEGHIQVKCPECRERIDVKKIFNYNIFKKVHLPEEYLAEHPELAADEHGSESDSESEDSDEEDSDADSQGDLRDFIVNDDEEEEEEEEEDDNDDDDKQENEEVKAEHVKAESIKAEDIKAEDDFNDSEGDDSGGYGHAVKSEHQVVVKEEGGSKKVAAGKGKSKAKKKRSFKGKGKGKAKKETKTLAELKKLGMRNAKAKRQYLRRLRASFISSAKIDETMRLLQKIQADDPTDKTIIFSQWTSFLDLLEIPIDGEGWRFRRYDGSMSADLRAEAVSDFMEAKQRDNVKIMLVSLKAGNAGLNLTAANHVIIMDPFWNPFVEDQAVDRAHRIGQRKDVHVHRILVQNTVEDRIIELQEKKRELIETALDEKAGQSLTRLGRRELRYLFGISSSLNEPLPPPAAPALFQRRR